MLYLAIALATFGMLRECDDSYFILCSKVVEVDCPEIPPQLSCDFKQCANPIEGCVAGNIWPGQPYEEYSTFGKFDAIQMVGFGEMGHLRVSRIGSTYCTTRHYCTTRCRMGIVSAFCELGEETGQANARPILTMTVDCVGGF